MTLTAKQIDNLNRWVEALESGKYQQCKNDLCKVDELGSRSYCCLGVAYEVLHGKDAWTKDDPNDVFLTTHYDTSGALNFDDRFALGITVDTQNRLARMNDLENKSFAEIAAFIRTDILKQQPSSKENKQMLPETSVGVAPIDGIDLAKIAAGQQVGALKQAQAAIEQQVRAATLDLYNLRTKRAKMLAEVAGIDANIERASARLERFKAGDWTALEPFEIKDKSAEKKDDKENK
jgi:hypothetical protein